MKRISALAALFLFSCSPAGGSAPDIGAADAWAREAGAGKTVSAAYLKLTNSGGADDALVAVTSSTGPAQLHSMSMDGGIMRMRELDRLPIPAGATVRLEPHGNHIMLTGLSAPLPAGSGIELKLRFEKSGEKSVSAAVSGRPGDHM